MTGKAVIVLYNGVTVKLEVITEPKHYSREERDEALNDLAKRLGGTFLYVERVEGD